MKLGIRDILEVKTFEADSNLGICVLISFKDCCISATESRVAKARVPAEVRSMGILGYLENIVFQNLTKKIDF